MCPFLGWGAIYGEVSSGGHRNLIEKALHVNVLESEVILFGHEGFFKNIHDIHIQISSGNSTAVAYINNLGGVKSLQCHVVAREIWEWVLQRNLILPTVRLPGSQNVLADKASRIF